jgi:protein tyrosine phosphatase (PTP) superfamily phosphohydrolase (DUF442 family)
MNTIRNFVQLTKNFGTAGQPHEKQFDVIASSGYQHVINLAMPDHPDSIPYEGSLVTSLGMNYIHIPVPFDAPKPKHVKYFCSIMSAFSKQKTFIHCIMNYRVSAFMYHYLSKVEKMDIQRSTSTIFDIWEPDPIWEQAIRWTASEIGL